MQPGYSQYPPQPPPLGKNSTSNLYTDRTQTTQAYTNATAAPSTFSSFPSPQQFPFGNSQIPPPPAPPLGKQVSSQSSDGFSFIQAAKWMETVRIPPVFRSANCTVAPWNKSDPRVQTILSHVNFFASLPKMTDQTSRMPPPQGPPPGNYPGGYQAANPPPAGSPMPPPPPNPASAPIGRQSFSLYHEQKAGDCLLALKTYNKSDLSNHEQAVVLFSAGVGYAQSNADLNKVAHSVKQARSLNYHVSSLSTALINILNQPGVIRDQGGRQENQAYQGGRAQGVHQGRDASPGGRQNMPPQTTKHQRTGRFVFDQQQQQPRPNPHQRRDHSQILAGNLPQVDYKQKRRERTPKPLGKSNYTRNTLSTAHFATNQDVVRKSPIRLKSPLKKSKSPLSKKPKGRNSHVPLLQTQQLASSSTPIIPPKSPKVSKNQGKAKEVNEPPKKAQARPLGGNPLTKDASPARMKFDPKVPDPPAAEEDPFPGSLVQSEIVEGPPLGSSVTGQSYVLIDKPNARASPQKPKLVDNRAAQLKPVQPRPEANGSASKPTQLKTAYAFNANTDHSNPNSAAAKLYEENVQRFKANAEAEEASRKLIEEEERIMREREDQEARDFDLAQRTQTQMSESVILRESIAIAEERTRCNCCEEKISLSEVSTYAIPNCHMICAKCLSKSQNNGIVLCPVKDCGKDITKELTGVELGLRDPAMLEEEKTEEQNEES